MGSIICGVMAPRVTCDVLAVQCQCEVVVLADDCLAVDGHPLCDKFVDDLVADSVTSRVHCSLRFCNKLEVNFWELNSNPHSPHVGFYPMCPSTGW